MTDLLKNILTTQWYTVIPPGLNHCRATFYCTQAIWLWRNPMHAANQLLTAAVIYSRKILLYTAQ